MSIKLTWLGHSAFNLEIDGHAVVVDPFLTGNPLAPFAAEAIHPELILLSHAHGDHLGDTVSIANRTGAGVVSNFEICNWLQKHGVAVTHGQNSGGIGDYDFMTVKSTIAFHSSSFSDGSYGGSPGGFIVTAAASGLRMYYAGDTALFSDMQLYGDEGIDVAFLPIGDFFTMGPADSLRAIQFIRPRYVVPMHYNTFPPIVQDVSHWAQRVTNETNATPIVLDPGGSFTVE
ncbi:MAG: metal-dependent hydrolase [Anaerolineae bacterium]|nr:metal-dependent hydrolase [Anaerolineae bacterium]NUQ06056.1 metal-dependent hydrolase [Anaerolineae bacterium]